MSTATESKSLVCVDIHGKKHEVAAEDISWLPGCYSVVIHDGKILLSDQHGKYVLPGGSGEIGEMLEATVVREVIEETGIQVANPRLIEAKSNLFIMPGINKPVHSIQLFYACDYLGGELSIDGLDEHEQKWSGMPEWIPLNELENLRLGSSFEWRDVVANFAVSPAGFR
jgi:ADP-ribose pyrophosphatase YjhB (NUDIX family)